MDKFFIRRDYPQIVTTLDLSDCQLDDEALGRYVHKYKFEKIVLEDPLIYYKLPSYIFYLALSTTQNIKER